MMLKDNNPPKNPFGDQMDLWDDVLEVKLETPESEIKDDDNRDNSEGETGS